MLAGLSLIEHFGYLRGVYDNSDNKPPTRSYPPLFVTINIAHGLLNLVRYVHQVVSTHQSVYNPLTMPGLLYHMWLSLNNTKYLTVPKDKTYELLLGVLFPDIRTLKNVPPKLLNTHEISFVTSYTKPSAFRTGVILHIQQDKLYKRYIINNLGENFYKNYNLKRAYSFWQEASYHRKLTQNGFTKKVSSILKHFLQSPYRILRSLDLKTAQNTKALTRWYSLILEYLNEGPSIRFLHKWAKHTTIEADTIESYIKLLTEKPIRSSRINSQLTQQWQRHLNQKR